MTAAPTMRGRLSDALRSVLMRQATITGCQAIAERFKLVTLEGPALRGVDWTAGQKVQVAMAAPFVTRTYTPIAWDAATGRTRILGYAHGDGPGAGWLRDARSGDTCDVFGPRGSLDVSRLSGPLAVFGDETSIGLGHALSHQDRSRTVACRFEVEDVESCRQVLAQLGLREAALFSKAGDGAHLDEMAAALPSLVAAGACFVLTGHAGTIQRLRQGLIQQAVPAARIVAKAYWAPGKTGLD